ncbi:MAG: hypothetical protein KAR33_12520, partial [Candidatus Thorarchaeota archaeon]|nr:hypothetical protein [Candidatus Thorarchaeota archaeon]
LVSNHISTVVEYESSMNCSLVENELDQGIYFEGSAANLFGIVDGNVVEESNLVLYDSLSSMTIDCNLIAQAIVLNCTNLNFTGGVFSTPFGIFVESSINCVFEDGSYLRNVYSIHVRNTTHCQFLNNTIHNSNLGFNILEVTSCDFVSNRISDSLTGMRVDSSHDCLFILNIFDNLHIGVYLTETTSHNALYSNVFDFSTQHKALDDGTENSFDNEAGIGNSWGDYLGFGVYAIPGDSGSIDHYPSPGIVGILTITAAIGSIIVILLLVIRKIVSNRGHLQ